ncbi:putative membrane protein (TIGR01666 family) [Pseudomonas duriflava]|uniref:Putative membrane protein (TIGR01666 family) n=1 Tax=Pseudomonas duriflava TaxID=459528 RepID=A0A562Q2E6_9PSED|nr:YccS family putative transporter [Pseudomonas duriflava]TWI50839.1 putative membrane protein (TIGR01666 family) [Pseudomonas duriflava]
MTFFGKPWRHLWAHNKASYGVRVFIALTGAMSVCWYFGSLTSISPVFLGIIASALAETDDNWLGRLKSLLATLLCFGIAAVSVELLFPYPWLFVIGLALATFSLTMLGALGERYASIAQATVILSIYGMIGVDQRLNMDGVLWLEPSLLLAGATWYGLLSVLWCALFAHQPVRQNLASLYYELGLFLRYKADLLEPVRQIDLHQRRLKLAQQNGKVVEALNRAKATILSRFGRSGRPGVRSGAYFKLYFMAQDIHERASSSHYPYSALTETFFHSDVLFRSQRLLTLQAKACAALGEAIRLRHPFDYGQQSQQAMADLTASLDYLKQQKNRNWKGLLRSLDSLCDNLATLERQLSEASRPEVSVGELDTSLLDPAPRSLKDMFQRVRLQLTPTSLLFRHGLRMALALAAGYGVLHLIHPNYGYWILLTTVFVCRPNYGATRLRLAQRIVGTVIGLLLGHAFLQLFETTEVQLLMAVVAGTVFFLTRTDRYTVATAAITVMVLFCFNQVGDGFGLIWPRLIDTLIGCFIAVLAVFFILPDWQGRRLHQVMANTLVTSNLYLCSVIDQYRNGKRDDLAYRVARRNVHNADATLSAALANMLREPGHFRRNLDAGFRFLALSNTLLSYLSALGAHRTKLAEHPSDEIIGKALARLNSGLDEIATALAERRPLVPTAEEENALADELEQAHDELDDGHRLVLTQLALISRLLPNLKSAAAYVLREPHDNEGSDTTVDAVSS